VRAGWKELPIAKLRPLFGMLEKEYAFQLDRRHFGHRRPAAGTAPKSTG